MEDDVGRCLPDGAQSSVMEDTFTADGDNCNSVVSLGESYPSPYFDRAETLDLELGRRKPTCLG
jgi:hypothetical protein